MVEASQQKTQLGVDMHVSHLWTALIQVTQLSR